jgi:nucleoid-associated protein YgaU
MAKHRSPPGKETWVIIIVLLIAGLIAGLGIANSQHGSSPRSTVTAPQHPAPHHTAKPSPSPQPPVQAHPHMVFHVVKAGDTLWTIAVHHSGHGQEWHRLYDLNKTTIGSNPNALHPGEVLRL